MAAFIAYCLTVVEPAQILSWLPSITVVLKFLSALAGLVAATPPAVRAYRRLVSRNRRRRAVRSARRG
ncbi:hypothetical protein [Micromonospora cathayae]|uniref:Uncharacterized protein n=1 Tax=Micromonospora cathayae TaxID=3028804 RepID=A0ABY7ZL93_9ACTN|nr:hypothetical protein [Micromonospora sp. HUAS 3]WDZ83765.1 hypothetical protein PVK37_25375 [Micromonospora sp. HUAS 3]